MRLVLASRATTDCVNLGVVLDAHTSRPVAYATGMVTMLLASLAPKISLARVP
jgi:hypothetical protein